VEALQSQGDETAIARREQQEKTKIFSRNAVVDLYLLLDFPAIDELCGWF